MPTVMTRTPKPRVKSNAAATPRNPKPAPTVAAKSRARGAEAQPAPVPPLNEQERHKLIAQAAYFRAEKRGFAPGCELQDWIEAEADVLRLIGKA